MSTDRQVSTHPRLDQQVAALSSALEAGEGLLDASDMDRARSLLQGTHERRRLSPAHTVIGLFGATGSGKSSVFNALAQTDVAQTGLIRPTTQRTTAAVWGKEDAFPLLDWLQVGDVWLAPAGAPGAAGSSPLNGTQAILLDLPDFDSISDSNRAVVDRLAQQVDVLVWLMDPQKYADRVIHDDYMRPMSHHSSVTLAVMNQADKLSAHQRTQVERSITELLQDDGLGDAPLFFVSAQTGEGIDALRQALAQIAQQRAAKDQRLSADISAWAAQAQSRYPAAQRKRQDQSLGPLVDAATRAARVDVVAKAVGAAYKQRAARKTGWFVTSWLHGFRSDPLRRLHLAGSKKSPSGKTTISDTKQIVAPTSLPPMTAASAAALSSGIRDYSLSVSAGLPDVWQQNIQQVTSGAASSLPPLLDQAVAQADFGVCPSWWWRVAQGLQLVAFLFALVGLGWYVAAWFSAAFGLPLVSITKYQGWPVPGMLLAFGLALGAVLGAGFAFLGSAGARRRERRAQRVLTQNVTEVIQAELVAPTNTVLDQMDSLQHALATAAQKS